MQRYSCHWRLSSGTKLNVSRSPDAKLLLLKAARGPLSLPTVVMTLTGVAAWMQMLMGQVAHGVRVGGVWGFFLSNLICQTCCSESLSPLNLITFVVSTQPPLSYKWTHGVMWPAGTCRARIHAEQWQDHIKTFSPVPLICQVCFIADQHDDDITSSLCPHVLDPLWCLLEGVHVCSRKKNCYRRP